jgi:hypothetical protein
MRENSIGRRMTIAIKKRMITNINTHLVQHWSNEFIPESEEMQRCQILQLILFHHWKYVCAHSTNSASVLS